MMVLFLVCLSCNFLLGPLMWWHRELFFGWNTVGANVGGIRKFGRGPRTQEQWIQKCLEIQMTWEETKNLLKTAHASKVVSPLYTCPRAPFYREKKGLLHSESTLESKEYS
jgi:hypothetical protein